MERREDRNGLCAMNTLCTKVQQVCMLPMELDVLLYICSLQGVRCPLVCLFPLGCQMSSGVSSPSRVLDGIWYVCSLQGVRCPLVCMLPLGSQMSSSVYAPSREELDVLWCVCSLQGVRCPLVCLLPLGSQMSSGVYRQGVEYCEHTGSTYNTKNLHFFS